MKETELNYIVMQNLQRLRAAHGMRQKEAAEKFGVSESTYQKYELKSHPVTPSLPVLIRIADYYQISLDELIGRTVPPHRPEKHSLAEHIALSMKKMPQETQAACEAAFQKAYTNWKKENK